MTNKKGLLFFLTFALLLNISVLALGEEGYTLTAQGGATWDSQYASLNVSEFTTSTPVTIDGNRYYVQLLNLSWKAPTNNVDVIFRFDREVNGGRIDVANSFTTKQRINENCTVTLLDGNDTYVCNPYQESYQDYAWNDVTNAIQSRTHNDKYYYGFENVNLPTGSHRMARLRFPVGELSNGESLKWDFGVKLNSDTISEAISTGRYIFLDPIIISNYTDDFEDNTINSTLWKTYSDNPDSLIAEQNGVLNMTNFATGNGLVMVWLLQTLTPNTVINFTINEVFRSSGSAGTGIAVSISATTNESESQQDTLYSFEGIGPNAQGQKFFINRSEDGNVSMFNVSNGDMIGSRLVDVNQTTLLFRSPNGNTGPTTHFYLEDFTSTSNDNTFSFLNLEILDEKTKVTATGNFDIDIIGTDTVQLTGISGSVSQLLRFGDYRITYKSQNYPQRDYYLKIANTTTGDIDLYALDSTNATQISYIIKDENFKPLENATIQALRFYISSNIYEVVEMDLSGFDGSGTLNLEQDDAFYKFRVLYNGKTKLDTVGTNINSQHVANGLNFQINTLTDTLADVEALQGAAASINFNTASNSFTFSSTDSGGVYDQACLEITGITEYTNQVVNTSCSTSDSSTIVIVVDNTTNTQYFAQGILINGDNSVVAVQSTKIFDSNNVVDIIGSYGIFLSIFVIILMGMATLYNPKSTIIVGSLGFAIPIFAGFSMFSIGLAILIFLGGIIVSYVIRLGEE